ncbi:nucleotidyltransferase family protein [Streptomyces sp. RG80]|uniref:nucleotidyltransferase family protein n=1 Tax=Streptomyces sp. RG80 TaxID=3157340 RepID=UPI00338E3342
MTQYADDTTGLPAEAAAPRLPAGDPESGLRDDPPAEQLPLDRNQAILEAAKRTGALLKQTGYPFALAGSVAVYAHGGAQNLQHDVDFCIRPEDAEAVAEALRDAGLAVHCPPEDWLLKATCLGQQVDLIFELAHQPVTKELLGRAEELSVDSVHMPVLSPTDLMSSLMAAFSEHHCDFGAVLPIARALREKIDWDEVRGTCVGAAMPEAFLYFLERLDVIRPPEEQR